MALMTSFASNILNYVFRGETSLTGTANSSLYVAISTDAVSAGNDASIVEPGYTGYSRVAYSRTKYHTGSLPISGADGWWFNSGFTTDPPASGSYMSVYPAARKLFPQTDERFTFKDFVIYDSATNGNPMFFSSALPAGCTDLTVCNGDKVIVNTDAFGPVGLITPFSVGVTFYFSSHWWSTLMYKWFFDENLDSKPTDMYLGFLTTSTSPVQGDATEIDSGTYTEYSRKQINVGNSIWTAPDSNGIITNSFTLSWPTLGSDWPAIYQVAFFDGPDSGTADQLVGAIKLSSPVTFTTGETPAIRQYDLSIQVS